MYLKLRLTLSWFTLKNGKLLPGLLTCAIRAYKYFQWIKSLQCYTYTRIHLCVCPHTHVHTQLPLQKMPSMSTVELDAPSGQEVQYLRGLLDDKQVELEDCKSLLNDERGHWKMQVLLLLCLMSVLSVCMSVLLRLLQEFCLFPLIIHYFSSNGMH